MPKAHKATKYSTKRMKQGTPSSLTSFTVFFFVILINFNHFQAKEIQPIISYSPSINQFIYKIQQWRNYQTQVQETHFTISVQTVISAVFCFLAASLSSAGGIGGGGLFIPILTIVAGVDLKTASSFSAFMVTGGSTANVLANLWLSKSQNPTKSLINYDIAILSEPCMLLGVSIGVICNLMFPEWLIMILFAVFLAWSTFKTLKCGVMYWNRESDEARRSLMVLVSEMMVKDGNSDGNEEVNGCEEAEPLLGGEKGSKMEVPWTKVASLFMIWCSFFVIYLLRGNRSGQSITHLEQCGVGYWILSSIQIPLALAVTAWILIRKDSLAEQSSDTQDDNSQKMDGASKKLVFPILALLAGILGGVFGIGGGMFISPLLLHLGLTPEITAATCSFMVFFSSTMSAFQYLLLGMKHIVTAVVFSAICFAGSVIGLVVLQRAIKQFGRASIIVFSVGIVMALSTVLISSFGALDVWRAYNRGDSMGFKLPC